jgi:hypothetical protein
MGRSSAHGVVRTSNLTVYTGLLTLNTDSWLAEVHRMRSKSRSVDGGGLCPGFVSMYSPDRIKNGSFRNSRCSWADEHVAAKGNKGAALGCGEIAQQIAQKLQHIEMAVG